MRARAAFLSAAGLLSAVLINPVYSQEPEAPLKIGLLDDFSSVYSHIGGTMDLEGARQAGEFKIVAGGQNLAAIVMFLADVHGLGLKLAQGLIVTESFYWDLNDKTRALGKRFLERTNRMPSMVNAGT
jgi:hypothetical protein